MIDSRQAGQSWLQGDQLEADVVLDSVGVERKANTFQVGDQALTGAQLGRMLLFSDALTDASSRIDGSSSQWNIRAWAAKTENQGRFFVLTSSDGREPIGLDLRQAGTIVLYRGYLEDPVAAPTNLFLTNFESARARGQFTACKSNLNNISTSLEMYASDHEGRYPAKLQGLIDDHFLLNVPSCPAAGKPTYEYRLDPKTRSYHLACKGHFHQSVGVPANFPQFDSVKGLMEGKPVKK